MKLAELQQFFAAAVTTGSGPIAGLDRVFVGTEELSASARLAIYNRGYFYRLLGALQSVFEHTQRALGEEEFERVGLGYLSQYPSEHAAVERVGRHFPGYLRQCSSALCADLAALEWARLSALVAPSPATLADPLAIDPVAFPGSRLRFVPSLHTLELSTEAVRAFAGSQGGGAEERCGLAVWRADHAVRHAALKPVEFQALCLARAGAAMAEVCALFDSGAPNEDTRRAFQAVAGWFAEHWVERLEIAGA